MIKSEQSFQELVEFLSSEKINETSPNLLHYLGLFGPSLGKKCELIIGLIALGVDPTAERASLSELEETPAAFIQRMSESYRIKGAYYSYGPINKLGKLIEINIKIFRKAEEIQSEQPEINSRNLAKKLLQYHRTLTENFFDKSLKWLGSFLPEKAILDLKTACISFSHSIHFGLINVKDKFFNKER